MSEPSARTVWFITGANRGIGLGLVRYILEENEHDIVFAGTRDPTKSNDLNELASKKEGRLFVLELSSESEEQAKAAAQVVKDKIGHVDVVIANAGKLGKALAVPNPNELISQRSRYCQLFRTRLHFPIARVRIPLANQHARRSHPLPITLSSALGFPNRWAQVRPHQYGRSELDEFDSFA